MADLLTSDEIADFTGILGDHFDTFSKYHTITVHKESTKTYSNVGSSNVMHGFGDDQNQTNVQRTHVSKSFPAIVVYDDEQNRENIDETAYARQEGEVRIKVKKDARDYIVDGTTLKVELDGKTFNVFTEDAPKIFLGLRYYVFKLKATD